jgi:hypothetical protein
MLPLFGSLNQIAADLRSRFMGPDPSLVQLETGRKWKRERRVKNEKANGLA